MMKGREALIVGSDDLVPGSASRANARTVGSALFNEASAGRPTASTSRRAGTVAESANSWRAKAAAVMLRFTIRLLSTPGFVDSARNRRCWPRSSLDRSCGAVPSVAWLAIAEVRKAVGALSSPLL